MSLSQRNAPQWGAFLRLSAVVMCWGLNYVFVKLALRDTDVLTITVLRFLPAAAALALLARVRGQPLLPSPKERRALGLIGALQIGCVSLFTTVGLHYASAGRSAVIVYTMQIWAIPLSWILFRQTSTRYQIIGSLVGLVGVLLFVAPWSHGLSADLLIGYAILIATAIMWATCACWYRAQVWQTPELTRILSQLVASAILSIFVWIIFGHPIHTRWTFSLVGVILFNGLIASSFCYLWFLDSLRVLTVAQAGQIVSMVPVFALIFGALLLSERLPFQEVTAAAVILAGIMISARRVDRLAKIATATA